MKNPPYHLPPDAGADRERLDHEARYAAVLETSPDAIVSINQAGLITDWNPAAEAIFGYSRELALGREASGFITPAETAEHRHAELVQNLKSGRGRLFGKRTAMTAMRANGNAFPVELTLTLTEERGERAFTACIRDVTERKLANVILRKSEERFRMLVETVADYAILLLDPRGRVLTWNAGVERIDGYRARDIIGRRFHRLYSAEDIERGKPEQALRSAGVDGRHSHEGWSVRKDGSLYWASVVLTALRYENGVLFGYSRIGCDHTLRREAECESRRLTAMLEKHLRERTAELEVATRRLRASPAR